MCVEVGLFGLQTTTTWVAAVISLEHRVQVVLVGVRERHSDLAGAGEGRHVRIDREGRPREQDLVALLAERGSRREEQLAAPVRDGDGGGIRVVALGDAPAKERRAGVRISVHGSRRALDRLRRPRGAAPRATRSRRAARCQRQRSPRAPCRPGRPPCSPGISSRRLEKRIAHCAEWRSARSFLVSPR